MNSTELTGVVAEHIAAVNAGDTDAVVATFAEDAYVNDARREFAGLDAIRRWVAKEMTGDKVTIDVREVLDHYGDTIVRGAYDGTYDKTNLPDELVLSELLQRPRRQDRQPRRHLQPARRLLRAAAAGPPRPRAPGRPAVSGPQAGAAGSAGRQPGAEQQRHQLPRNSSRAGLTFSGCVQPMLCGPPSTEISFRSLINPGSRSAVFG